MSNNNPYLEKQISHLEKISQCPVYTVRLPDLAMMQSIGPFSEFIQTVYDEAKKGDNSFRASQKILEDTRKNATNYNRYSHLVNQSIEGQFSRSEVALRELGQNGIDSYSVNDADKAVIFNLTGEKKNEKSHEEKPKILHCRDYGKGMSFEDFMMNLLVPYKSDKEDDPAKIGEHGIGFYSVFDIVSYAAVTSKKSDGVETTKGIIYKENGDWYAKISPSVNAMPQDSTKGTNFEGAIDIKKQDIINNKTVLHALYEYFGMCDESKAKIFFKDKQINRLRKSYKIAQPVDVELNGLSRPLIMGVTTIDVLKKTDAYKYRELSLDKIIHTQNGIFVKYEKYPFEDGSIHKSLFSDMTGSAGVDFWVDAPDHAGLIKNRGNYNPDEAAFIENAIYRAFESAFTDIILNDEKLIGNQHIQNSIAKLFNENYKSNVRKQFEQNVPYHIRALKGPVDFTLNSIDKTKRAFSKFGKGLKKRAVFTPNVSASCVNFDLEDVVSAITKCAVIVLPTAAVVYGGYELYKHFGIKPFLYAGGVIGTAAVLYYGNKLGKYAYKNREDIQYGLKEFWESLNSPIHFSPIHLSVDWDKIRHNCNNIKQLCSVLGRGILHKIGLYVDIEEKRERKRVKIHDKLTHKYVAGIYKDDFFKKIAEKKIIPAIRIRESETSKKRRKEENLSLWDPKYKSGLGFSSMFKDMLGQY